jgi:hypothetical protein
MRRSRGLAVSFLVRRNLAAASVSHTAAAELLGVSRQRFEKLLDEGLLQAGDLLALEDMAPGLIAEWLKGKFKVTPERAAGTPRDIMGELGDVMASVGVLAAETAKALEGGITHAEAQGIVRGCEAIRREVGELEGAVNAARVGPPVRSLR